MSISITRKELRRISVQVKRGLSSYYIKPNGLEVFLINIKDVMNGKINPKTVGKIRIKETDALGKSRIQPDDVIITVKGSAFKAATASRAVQNYVISANLIAVTVNDEILPELIVAYLNSTMGQLELQSRAVGIAQKSINPKSLMEICIPIPPKDKQKQLTEYFLLSKEYDALIERERELRKQINNHIVQIYMMR